MAQGDEFHCVLVGHAGSSEEQFDDVGQVGQEESGGWGGRVRLDLSSTSRIVLGMSWLALRPKCAKMLL